MYGLPTHVRRLSLFLSPCRLLRNKWIKRKYLAELYSIQRELGGMRRRSLGYMGCRCFPIWVPCNALYILYICHPVLSCLLYYLHIYAACIMCTYLDLYAYAVRSGEWWREMRGKWHSDIHTESLFLGGCQSLFSLPYISTVFLLLEFSIQLTGQPWSLFELFNRQSRRFREKSRVVESSRDFWKKKEGGVESWGETRARRLFC